MKGYLAKQRRTRNYSITVEATVELDLNTLVTLKAQARICPAEPDVGIFDPYIDETLFFHPNGAPISDALEETLSSSDIKYAEDKLWKAYRSKCDEYDDSE